MPQLSEAIVSETKFVVTKWTIHIELLLRGDTHLQLMFSARVCHYLPVVDAIGEGPVGDERAEVVIRFVEEGVTAIFWELDFLRGVVRVPREVVECVHAAQ